ncbi:MAG: hypothetical protein RIR97_1525 [Pseudomonadota bacterium]
MGRLEMNIRTSVKADDAIGDRLLHYKDCGLDQVYLKNGFALETIDGEETLSISDLDGLHMAIGLHIALEKKAPSPKDLRFLRHELDMSQAELADILSVSDQTVARWEKGQREPGGTAVFALRLVYLLATVPDAKKTKLFRNLLKRLAHLTDMGEAEESVTCSFIENKWQTLNPANPQI